MYEYCKKNNQTLRGIFDDLQIHLQNISDTATWKDETKSFVQRYIGNYTDSMEVDLTKYINYNDKEQWNSIVHFVKFYSAQMALNNYEMTIEVKKRYNRFFIKDWLNKIRNLDINIGSLFIKSLTMPNCDTSQFMMNGIMNCKAIKDYMEELHQIFTIPGQNLSLPDIAYMYSTMDYLSLYDPIINDPLVNLKNSFFECIKKALYEGYDSSKELEAFKDKVIFQNFSPKADNTLLPCLNLKQFKECVEYCGWHNHIIKEWKKDEFLSFMRYALPQRKLSLDPTPYEQQLAGKLFGIGNLKDLSFKVAPTAMPIFCHEKYRGFLGDHIGLSAKVCNDFFPVPSDNGICLTRNLDLKEILHPHILNNPIYEADISRSTDTILGGSLWSETTLVISTDSSNGLQQTYNRKNNKMDKNFINFQIHQSKDLAKFHLESEMNDYTSSLKLEANHEYFIDVTPTGQISTKDFKSLNLNQRKCHLVNEVSRSSQFKIYTKNNCKYECYVMLAKEACKCIPWDFEINGEMSPECDIFGRTCFFKTMEQMAQSPINKCRHCIKECDYLDYHKVIKSKNIMDTGSFRKHIVEEYGSDQLYGDQYLIEFLQDKNYSVTDKGLVNFWNSFVVEEKEKYESIRFINKSSYSTYSDVYSDMIIIHLRFLKPKINSIDSKYTLMDSFAMFGGNFGIFVEMTGCSFFVLLNISLFLFKMLVSSRQQ